MTLLMIYDKHHQNSESEISQIWKKTIKIISNSEKLLVLLGDRESMTNYLLFETNPGVLAQFV